jgi:hypothetical protein
MDCFIVQETPPEGLPLCRVREIGCKLKWLGILVSLSHSLREPRTLGSTALATGGFWSRSVRLSKKGRTVVAAARCTGPLAGRLLSSRPHALLFSQVNSKYRVSSTELASWDPQVSSFPKRGDPARPANLREAASLQRPEMLRV